MKTWQFACQFAHGDTVSRKILKQNIILQTALVITTESTNFINPLDDQTKSLWNHYFRFFFSVLYHSSGKQQEMKKILILSFLVVKKRVLKHMLFKLFGLKFIEYHWNAWSAFFFSFCDEMLKIMSHIVTISLYRYSINYLIKRFFIFSLVTPSFSEFVFQFGHSDTLSSHSTW